MTETISIPAPAPSRTVPLLVLVAGACVIAFAPIFVRLTATGPAAAGFWRLALALPALAAMAFLASRRPGGSAGLGPTRLTLLAGVFFALDLGFWHYGIKFTTVANATILANLSPVVVTAAAWLLLGERPRRAFLAGLVMALAGAWIIAAARGGGGGLDPGLGDALSIATSVWYAAYMLVVRKARASQTTSRVMLWSSLAGAGPLLAAALILREQVIPASAAGWAACLGLAAVQVAGQGAIAWSLGRLPAALASVTILIQPVAASVLGWIIFHEPMSPLQIAGGALALTGVLAAQLGARPARAAS